MTLEQIYKEHIDHSHAAALQAVYDAGRASAINEIAEASVADDLNIAADDSEADLEDNSED